MLRVHRVHNDRIEEVGRRLGYRTAAAVYRAFRAAYPDALLRLPGLDDTSAPRWRQALGKWLRRSRPQEPPKVSSLRDRPAPGWRQALTAWLQAQLAEKGLPPVSYVYLYPFDPSLHCPHPRGAAGPLVTQSCNMESQQWPLIPNTAHGGYLGLDPAVAQQLWDLGQRWEDDEEALPYVVNHILAHFPEPEVMRESSDADLSAHLDRLRDEARLALAQELAGDPACLGLNDPYRAVVLRCMAADRGDTWEFVLREATRLSAQTYGETMEGLRGLLSPTTDHPEFWLGELAETIRATGWLGQPNEGPRLHGRCERAYRRRLRDPRDLREAGLVQRAIWHGLQSGRARAQDACELLVYADAIEQDLGEKEARTGLLQTVVDAARQSPVSEVGELAEHLLGLTSGEGPERLLALDGGAWPFPLSEYLQYAKARVLLEQSRFDESVEVAEQLCAHLETQHLSRHPAAAQLLLALAADTAASANRRRGQLSKAKQRSVHAIALAEGWERHFKKLAPWMGLLTILFRERYEAILKDLGDLEGARREVTQALTGIAAFPGRERGWLQVAALGLKSERADVARHLGDWASSRELLSIVRDLEAIEGPDPEDPVVRQQLATAHRRAGVYCVHIEEYAEAERHHRKALRLLGSPWAERSPDLAPQAAPRIKRRSEGLAIMSLGLVWQRQRRADAALNCFLACMRHFRRNDNRYSVILAHHRAGAALRDLGYFDEAREWQERALTELCDVYPDARFRRIEILRKLIVTLLVSGREEWRTEAAVRCDELRKLADEEPPRPYHKAAAFLRFAEELAGAGFALEARRNLAVVEKGCRELLRGNPELRCRHLFLKARLSPMLGQGRARDRVRWMLSAAEAAVEWGNRRRAREAFAYALAWASTCRAGLHLFRKLDDFEVSPRFLSLLDEVPADAIPDDPVAPDSTEWARYPETPGAPGASCLLRLSLAHWALQLPLERFGDLP